LAGAALSQCAQALTIKVTTNNPAVIPGDNRCSLIEAIQNANDTTTGRPNVNCAAGNRNGADTITLPKRSTHTLIYGYDYTYGATGLPLITSQITITGSSAKIVRSGNAPYFRLMAVGYGGNLTLQGLTLSGGSYYGSQYYGGGVLINYQGSLKLDKTTILGNKSNFGGGVFSSGSLTITNGSTVSGNNGFAGGGVFAGNDEDGNSGRITIASSTITGNTAANGSLYSSFGGGIYNSYAPTNNYLTLNRSLISGNSATNGSEIANFQPITAQVYVPPVYYPNDTEPPYDILTPGGYITVNVISADNFNLFGSNNDPGIYNDPLITPPSCAGVERYRPAGRCSAGPAES
jgi:hypothetical protein